MFSSLFCLFVVLFFFVFATFKSKTFTVVQCMKFFVWLLTDTRTVWWYCFYSRNIFMFQGAFLRENRFDSFDLYIYIFFFYFDSSISTQLVWGLSSQASSYLQLLFASYILFFLNYWLICLYPFQIQNTHSDIFVINPVIVVYFYSLKLKEKRTFVQIETKLVLLSQQFDENVIDISKKTRSP